MSEAQKNLGLVRFMWGSRVKNVFCGIDPIIGYFTKKYRGNAKKQTSQNAYFDDIEVINDIFDQI